MGGESRSQGVAAFLCHAIALVFFALQINPPLGSTRDTSGQLFSLLHKFPPTPQNLLPDTLALPEWLLNPSTPKCCLTAQLHPLASQ